MVAPARLAALVPALLLAGCWGEARSSQPRAPVEPPPVAVRVAAVGRATLSAVYATSATLRAPAQATVIARTRGVVRELLAEEGDEVAANAPVARLEDDEQRIERDRAQVVLAQEEREHARAEQLRAERALSQNDLDAARRELDDARHRAAVAELSLARTTVRAPFAGRILHRHLSPGATVADGTPVYDLAQCDPLEADVAVPERHVGRLAAGQPARLVSDALVVPAKILRISPAVDPRSGTVKVTVAATGACALRPGAFVRVEVVTAVHPDALVVPKSALVALGSRWHVARLLPPDRTARVEVVPGLEQQELVEVAAPPGGVALALTPGDVVVAVGAAGLAEGARVEVVGEPVSVAPVETATR